MSVALLLVTASGVSRLMGIGEGATRQCDKESISAAVSCSLTQETFCLSSIRDDGPLVKVGRALSRSSGVQDESLDILHDGEKRSALISMHGVVSPELLVRVVNYYCDEMRS